MSEQDERRACVGIKRDLLDCLNQSDCVRKDGHTPRECLVSKTFYPEECIGFRQLLYRCKRSQVDMRARFRGKMDY